MKRPILIAVIGYVTGIIWGLYFKKSIAFFLLFCIGIYFAIKRVGILENKNIKKKIRYLKIWISKKTIILFIIAMIISNIITLYQIKQYDAKYEGITQANFVGVVVSQPIEKEYAIQYKVRIKRVNTQTKYNNTEVMININKSKARQQLEYGDEIIFEGEYTKPKEQRNEGGFNEKEYNRSIGLYGKIKVSKLKVQGKRKGNLLEAIGVRIASKIQNKIEEVIQEEDIRNVILGILIGKDENLSGQIQEIFRNSSLSHILAVSGMHVSYLIMGVSQLLKISKLEKKAIKASMIVILVLFCYITGGNASIKRATIMTILSIIAGLLYRKSDTITNLALSLLIILIQNPFSIQNTGLILSFGGTIGIILGYPMLHRKCFKKDKELLLVNNKTIKEKIYLSCKEVIVVTVSAQIVLIPLIMLFFNTISFTFFLSSLGISFLIGPMIGLGFFLVCIPNSWVMIINLIGMGLKILVNAMLFLAKYCAMIPISHVVVTTPKIFSIFFYYFILAILFLIVTIREKSKNKILKEKLENSLNKIKNKVKKQKLQIILLLILIVVINLWSQKIPKQLQIHFIDVGQGDACLMLSPYGKSIMVDTGGNLKKEQFDIGERIIVPYLLDKGIKKLDYLCISHFDADHCQGAVAILEKLKVKQLIITKQIEVSNEYETIVQLAKKKKVGIRVVKQGDRIQLDTQTYLDILSPKTTLVQKDLNNNSIVAKLVYGNFSMLFTGDIEKETEAQLYKEQREQLKNIDLLKVAHHGSKTSSTAQLIEVINPKIAIIGVGENNTFGHPNKEILERLERMWM